MDEIIFTIEQNLEGGFTAKSIDKSIFTEGNNLDELKQNIRNAVTCHFEDQQNIQRFIKLRFTKKRVC